MASCFADIILPLAIRGKFTYLIPDEMSDKIFPGSRVLVPFGKKKLYSGIIDKIHGDMPPVQNIKSVCEILDAEPLVNEKQLEFWHWIADYYMCSLGEVMKASLPSALCLEGDSSSPVVHKYRPREESFVELASSFSDEELNKILDRLAGAPKQFNTLTAYLSLSGYLEGQEIIPVRKSLLIRQANSSNGVIDALVVKGILSVIMLKVSRLHDTETSQKPLNALSRTQASVFNSISTCFHDKDIVLLHGVTSSGKTEIYIHLIEQQLRLNKQVLYLLPEISLTTQIIIRLVKHFGPFTGVYHSKFNDAEKVEIWERVMGKDPEKEYRLILGVRSALLLPFNNLGLIIVDEEHDGSYKQQDPAPRYNARDSAIMLASFHKARVILGSASPSVESYHNAMSGMYGLFELSERYGSIRLPEIIVANTQEAYRKKLMVSHFTPQLLEAMNEALENSEQIILFQNRRGFSPYIHCPECGWVPSCVQCAVSLTYHKSINRLICHYCGYSTELPSKCGNCNSPGLSTRGFGTEKIEDEIKIIFPSARIARMDQDTTGGKGSFSKLIKAFEQREIDILIGTQMISKGLDIENLTVVGIMNADSLMNFPDFRAHERSYQLMEQVSGRAGRRQKRGRVIIQTSDPSNKIIRLVLRHDYNAMYRMQIEERKIFNYPPFCRMIKIIIRHRNRYLLNSLSDSLGKDLRSFFGKRVLGPEYPLVSRIQNWYIKTILLKIEKGKSSSRAKQYISEAIDRLVKETGSSSLRIAVDVDPY